jgi:putative thioredoxin
MVSSDSAFVIAVDTDSFETEVIERSRTVPVLVDFWAPWCGPCRVLGPILEKLAAEYRGGFILAKLNTDENPRISAEFRIQGIPNVMLFRDGGVVDQFVGAYPESGVRKFLDSHLPSEADKVFSLAQLRLEEGKPSEAELLLNEVLRLDPKHSAAHLALAKALINSGRGKQALPHLEAIPGLSDEYESAARLREVLAFQDECEQGGGEQLWRQRLAKDPDDLDSRFALACCLAAAGKYPDALDEFLTLVAKDKRYRDAAPRKAMLAIFSVIGERSVLADEYRTRLARTLY